MKTFQGTVNEVFPQLVAAVAAGPQVGIDRADAVSSVTRELHPVVVEVTSPRRRLVTSYGRPVNVTFALAEVVWILAGRADVEMLKPYNSTIGQFSDDGDRFNAAYGYRIRHSFGHDQLEDIIRTLAEDPTSRQATVVISNPVDDKGWDRVIDEYADPPQMIYKRKQTKDRACNLVSHFMIRDDRLDLMQVVRSNDVMWGLPYNLIQFTHLMEYVAARLGIEVGTYYHVADSLHMYDHHFVEAEMVSPFDAYAMSDIDHSPMSVDIEALNVVYREEELMRQKGGDAGEWQLDTVGHYWSSVLWMFKAHAYYKEGRDLDAVQALLHADFVYCVAQMRFYYQHRWYQKEFAPVRSAISNAIDSEYVRWIKARV